MNRGRKEAGVLLQKSSNMNRLLPAIFLLLTGAIAVSGYVYYQKQKKAVIHEQTTQLKAIADLKAIQIRDWLRERTGDARLIQQNPIMVAELAAFLGDRSRETRRIAIQRWMASMRSNYHYENVMLLDRRGEVILSATSAPCEPSAARGLKPWKPLSGTGTWHYPICTRDPKVPHIHLDLVAPVLVGNEIVGCVFLRIDPSVFLYPMIQSWPTHSPSAETLLVKREGENVLFLNELRHRQGAAMTLRMPLHNMDLPAALAVLGKVGITAGHDYRGIAVRSVSRSIPDTPWFIVAKIDEEEITAPLRRSARVIFSVVLALIIATALVVLTLWRYQATRFQQRQLETENQRLALAQHFDYLTRYANDIILLSDEKWQILEANERAMLAYGRNREELLKMNLRDLRVPDERSKLAAEYKQTEEMLGAIFETWHMKKDGSIFPVEVSARVIAIDGKKYYQSIIRNISERKQAENALRESEEKFKQVFETANVGKSITQLNGEINVNQAFCDMLGYSREELQKTKWQELTPANEITSTQKVLEPLLQGRQNTARFNKRYVHKNGSTVWGDVSVAIKRDAAGKPLHFITTVVDISERKKAEEEIESARAFLEMIINMSPFAMWISNAEGTVIRVNRSLCEAIHLSQDQIEGKYNVLNDENLEKQGVMPQVKAVFARHEPARFSIPWMAAGAGSIDFKEAHNMHIDVSMFPIANAQGELVNVVCQWIDISKRKLAEKALHESEAKFRQTFEFSPVGIVMVGLDKRFIGSNKAFSESLGYSPEELVGKTIADFTHPADILIGMDEMKAIARGDLAISQVQKRYLHKDGRTIWGEATISLIRNQNANPQYFLAIIQNISKRKQAEEKLKDSEERFHLAMRASNDGLFDWNLETNAIYYSPGWKKMLGYADHELANDFSVWEKTTDPEDVKKSWALQQKLISKQIDRFVLEFKMKHKAGHWVDILSRAEAIFNDNGKAIRIVGTHSDITERKQAEEAIRRSEERLRAILDATPFPIAIVDVQDSKIDFWSSSALALFGHTAPTTAEWYELAYPDPDYRNEVIARWKPFLEKARSSSQGVNTGEYRVTCHDGSVIICELYASFLADNLIVTFNNVTERKQAEAAVVLNSQRVQTLLKLNQMNDASLKEITDFALEEAVRLTRSTIGYLAFLNDDESVLTMHSWSKSAMAECAIIDKPIVYPVESTGLWGEAVRQRQAVITNEYAAASPLKKGCPQGHVAVKRHMNTPVFAGSRIVMVAGVGNKTEGYDQDDVQQLTLLMEGMWRLIERKHAEEALQESERKFRETVVTLDEGYYSVTLDGKLLEHNQAFNRILGFDIHEDLKGIQLPDFWQYPDQRKEYLLAFAASGSISNYQIEAKTQNGDKITILASAHLVKEENDRPQRIEGVFLDISERMRMEKALLLKNLVFDVSIAANSIADSNGIITEVNDAFLRVWGYPRKDQVVGKPLLHFINDPNQAVAIVTALNTTSQWEGDYAAKKNDGSTFIAHGQATTVKDEKGKAIGYQSAVMDVTEQREAEQELMKHRNHLEQLVAQRTALLEAANKELEAFSYSVSHDLRAPLRAIDGFSRIVLEDYSPKLDNEGQRLLNIIAGNTQKMGRLIDDLLAFSRLSRQQITFAAVDMAALAETIFSELKNLEKGRKIEFKVGVLPISYGDHSMLYHVLLNLLSNALKFTRPKAKARIEFGGQTAIGETVYYVKDNGVGFDMAYADKLFGVFQRLHGTDEFEGTGVGLAIVQRIVVRHGGRVWAESGKNGGATFYFSLPKDANPGMAEPAPAS